MDASRRDTPPATVDEAQPTIPASLWKHALTNISDAVFLTDDAGHLTFICPNVHVIFGYGPEEVAAMGTLDALLGEGVYDPAALREHDALHNIEWMITDKQGAEHHVLVNVKAVAIEDSTVLVTCHDVTDRWQIEATRQASRQFLHATLDALSDHIAVLDVDGTIIAVNAAWQRFAYQNGGDPSRTGTGINYLDVCDRATDGSARGAGAMAAGIRAVMAGRRASFSLEYPCHAPTEQRWFHGCVTRFADYSPVRCVVVHRDITKRRQLEQEVLVAAEAEQRRIAHELHDDLASHLTGTLMLASTVLSQMENNEVSEATSLREIVDLLREATERTRTLSRSFLPSPVENGLGHALQDLAHRMEALHDVRCTVDRQEHADIHDSFAATHLYRIAQESIANAVRHGQAQHITLRVTANAHHLQLEIVDDGTGISEEAVTQSSGIGLRTMTYRARLIGGMLDVHPGPEGGTVVTCTLPG